MPILAVIDVDDNGSLVIKNFKDEIEGLDLTLRKSREEGEKSKKQATEQKDALDKLTDEVRRAHMETLKQVQGLQLVSREMKAGGIATKTQVDALRQLAEMTARSNLLTSQQKLGLASVSQAMQAGQTITKQQAAAIQSAAQAATNAVQANAGLSQSLGNLQGAAMALAGALGAAGLTYVLKNYLDESFRVAARNEVLSTSMGVVAKNSNRSAIEMELQAKKIQALGITTKESRDAVLDFAQANMKLADAAKLARTAQDLAVVGGTNSSEAFNRLTRAIQMQQPIMLRQFGIVTGLDEIYTKYARSIGKTQQQLDTYEKRMAFFNRIQEEGVKVAGAYDLAMGDVGKLMGSTARLTEELQNKIGKALLPVMLDLVEAQHAVLKGLAGLSPEWHKWIAAVGVGITVLSTLLTVLINLSRAIALVKMLGSALLALTETHPVLLALTVALTAVVMLWVRFRGEAEFDEKAASDRVSGLIETTDALNAQVEAVKKAQKAYVEARKTNEDVALAQRTLSQEINKLNSLAPGAVSSIDSVTGAFKLNEEQIQKVLDQYQKLREETTKDTGKELDRVRAELNKLTLARDEISNVLEGKGAVSYTQLSTKTREALKQVVGNLETGLRALTGTVRGGLEDYMTEVKDKIKELIAMEKDLAQRYGEMSGEGTAARIAGLRASIKDLAGSEAELKGFLGRMGKSWADFGNMTEDQLRDVETAVRGFVEKNAQDRQKWEQSFKTTYQNITQTAATTGADFSAVAKALGEVAVGTDAYATRLLRAKGVLDSYEKSSPALRKQFQGLKDDIERLKASELEDTFRKWTDKAEEAAAAIEQVLAEERGKDRIAVEERVSQAEKKLREDRIQMAREALRTEEELLDRRTEGQLTAVEKELLANNRYYRDKKQALQDEIRLRQEAMDEEFRQLELTRQARDRELTETIARAKQRFKVELETATGIERAKQAMASGRSKEQVEKDIRDIETKFQVFLAAQEKEQRESNTRIYEMDKAMLDLKKQDLDAYVERVGESLENIENDNAATNARIARESSYTYKIMAEYAASFVQQVSNGFADIITGAKSFKDVFIGIWESIKSAVNKIMNDIVGSAVNGLLGIGTGGRGGIGGMVQQLSGLFGASRFGAGTIAQGGIGAVAGGAPWAVTPYAGAGAGAGAGGAMASAPAWLGPLLAAAGGGLAGFGLGRFMPNRTVGAFAGAGAGAATGAAIGMFGGPIGVGLGAGIGALAGLVGGLFGGGSGQRAARRTRDQYFEQAGGIDAILKSMERLKMTGTGLLDKVLNARNVKDTTNAIKELEKAMKEAEEAIALQKAKDGLAKTDAQMKALQKSAQLVGYDLQKLYDTKSIEEFNAEQEKLNDLLEKQKARMEALNKAAQGFADRTAASVAHLNKAVSDLLKAMPADRVKAIEDAFKRAQEGGFQGGMAKFLSGDAGKGLLDPKELERLKKATEEAKLEFGRLGKYATAIFANILRETGDIVAAMDAIGPALDQMIQMQDELGIKVDGPINKLLYLRRVMTDNADVVQALSGLTNMINGLGEAGALNAELLSTFGQDAAAQWKTMMDRGIAADAALMLMQPTLQALYEAQKRYGLTVDETTQGLIDMGLANGVVGDQFMDVNERIFDILLLIAETLGADIPDAFKKAKDAADRAATTTTDKTGDSNDALDAQSQILADLKGDWRAWGDNAVNEIQRVRRELEGGGVGGGPGGIGGGPPSQPGAPPDSSADVSTRGRQSITIGGGTQTVIVQADGRKLAEVTVPYLPRVARSYGLTNNR